VFFHCGWCLEQSSREEPGAIIEYYQRAADKTNHTIVKMNSYFRSGWIWLQARQFSRAVEHFSKVMELAERTNDWNEIACNSLYWYAVSLESLGKFLEAIECHRKVQSLSETLSPESRFREIQCLVRVGAFPEALNVCRVFGNSPPPQFDPKRFRELKQLVEQEERALETVLNDDFLSNGKMEHDHSE